jgi:hypothetical protein
MVERFLEDFTVGQSFGSGRLKIDAEAIKRFAAEFDPQPFHLDEQAASNPLFRGLKGVNIPFGAVLFDLPKIALSLQKQVHFQKEGELWQEGSVYGSFA